MDPEGRVVECQECVQPILDKNIDRKDCLRVPERIIDKLRKKEKTQGKIYQKKKSLELVDEINCNCGNKIKMFRKHDEVKCFKCNTMYEKQSGAWQKTNVVINKDTFTIGDFLKENGIKVR